MNLKSITENVLNELTKIIFYSQVPSNIKPLEYACSEITCIVNVTHVKNEEKSQHTRKKKQQQQKIDKQTNNSNENALQYK